MAVESSLEAPNIVTLLSHAVPHSKVVHFLHQFETPFFSAIVIAGLAVMARAATRHPTIVPGPLQNLVEIAVDAIDRFVLDIMGPQGRKYTPFVGTLFLYILTMNLIGIVPGMKSPTSVINTTVALALTVFIYVQYTGIRSFGLLGYLHHLAGSPRPKSFLSWLIVPLTASFNFILHLFGELTKPLSLSMRLFGNIFGEDVLIAQMLILGIAATGFLHIPVGLPLQLPFYFLAILTSIVQAMVFSLLSTIYLFLMLPHEAHEEAAKGKHN